MRDKKEYHKESSRRKAFAAIEILVSLVIIAILYYILTKAYFKKAPGDESLKKSLQSEGIDASSHKAIIESTKEKMKDINKKALDRQKQWKELAP